MRVDVHAHWYPVGSIADLVARGRGLSVRASSDGGQIVLFQGSVATTIGPNADDLQWRVSRMDGVGVDVQVLSWGALDVHWAGSAASAIARRVNDELAAICRAGAGRFRFLAVVPIGDRDGMRRELERALALGAVGVATTTTVAGRPLDAPEYRQFWALADELEMPVLVHPCYPASGPRGDDGQFLLVGFPGETTLAATRLALGGLLADYPAARVIWSHVGGAIPMLLSRIEAAARRFPGAATRPALALARCYYDTVCTHGPALDCARASFGASQLMFGTDEPHQLEAPEEIVAILQARDWSSLEIQAALGATAERLLRLS